MPIYLTAIIQSKSEHTIAVAQVLENMVIETRKETACIQYDLHQGIEDKDLFVCYEIWENQQGLDLHNAQPYIKAFGQLIDEKLQEKPVVYKMYKI